MRTAKSLFIFTLVFIPIGVLVLAARGPGDVRASRAARGEYLVKYGGCSDCHTPRKVGAKGPEPDMSRFLSGHPADAKLPPPPAVDQGPWFAGSFTAWAGPWGVSYASNLTPDRNTGMGIWTREMFIKAMRTGKHYGVARDLLPPMPWQSVGALSDEDLTAVYEYLRAIPPVRNAVPDPVPPAGRLNYE